MSEAPASPRAELATEDGYRPPYGKAELQRALDTERRRIAELEASAEPSDLAVRRRFVAALETCDTGGHACPPRLDEAAGPFDPDPEAPALDVPLRFDRASWQAVAAEVHGRACACRTLACVDHFDVAIGRLELRPMPEVQGDETASQSITSARECLFRLRGRTR